MKKLFIAAVVAVFLSAVTTDIFFRFFASGSAQTEQYFSLFVLLTLCILIANLITERAIPLESSEREPRKTGTPQERKPRKRKHSSSAPTQAKPESKQSPAPAPKTSSGPREEGTVKWFNRNKGFGFLVRDNGEEIFVHFRAIRDTGNGEGNRKTLKEGQSVSFSVVERDKGPQADDVVPL